DGLEGGARSGPDAAALLREATGWDIPVAALTDWMRGLRAQGQGPASLRYGADGRLARIEQGGWSIDYRWPAGDAADLTALPSRLDAVRGEAKVKLIVDQWEQGVATASTEAAPRSWTPIDDSVETQLRNELAGLNIEDPAADMRASVARGDLRAISVCGYSCELPGLTGADSAVRGSRILKGTGDVIYSPQYGLLLERGRAYALTYNRALAEWLKAHPPEPVATRD
ncbi:MAG: outer membrane lipoprotein LolB, partial [Lysobacter sp.]|nr:outer membrane lipoprotein LolB [Lysobacter sp.]